MKKLSSFSDCFPSLIFHNVNLIVPLSINQLAETEGHHACLEWKSPEIKVLRWDFDELSVRYTHSDQNNWIWNQNQTKVTTSIIEIDILQQSI